MSQVKWWLGVVCVACAECSVVHAGVADGLQLYLNLDGTVGNTLSAGSTIADLSGSNRNGTIVVTGTGGTAPSTVTGEISQGVKFNNIYNSANYTYADFGDVLDIGTGSYSVSLWFKATSAQYLYKELVFLSKGNRLSGAAGWEMVEEVVSGHEYVAGRVCGMTGVQIDITNLVADSNWVGSWHNLVLTLSATSAGSGQTTYAGVLYLDGSAAGDADGTSVSGGAMTRTVATVNSDTAETFKLGENFAAATPNSSSGLQGSIDEVGIWNRALDADEVNTIYQSGLSGQSFVTTPEPASLAILGLPELALIHRRRLRYSAR